jgi:hypothetical protein
VASQVLDRHSTAWVTIPGFWCYFYFRNSASLLAWASLDEGLVPSCLVFPVEMFSHKLFCLWAVWESTSSWPQPALYLRLQVRHQSIAIVILPALAGWYQENHSCKPDWANSLLDLIWKISNTKKDWRSVRAPAYKEWGPYFKTTYHKKKKKLTCQNPWHKDRKVKL